MITQGKWKGYYSYAQGYPPPFFGERVSIDVELIDDNDDGFEGASVEEDSEIAIPGNARISGFIQEGMISFVKTYPDWAQLGDGRKYEVEEGKEMEIRHYGAYDEQYGCFYGFWELEVPVFDNIMGPNQVVYGGTWKLERV